MSDTSYELEQKDGRMIVKSDDIIVKKNWLKSTLQLSRFFCLIGKI